MRRNSITDLWAFRASFDRVNTFIPSITGVAQAGSGFGARSTSTRHMRQFAATESLSW